MGNKIYTRWALRRDYDAIIDIAGDYSPLSRSILEHWPIVTLVAVSSIGETVHGFVTHRVRDDLPEWQRFHIGVRSDMRRQGIGRHLFNRIPRSALPDWVIVHESNLPGQCFLRAMGFKATRIIREQNSYRFNRSAAGCVRVFMDERRPGA